MNRRRSSTVVIVVLGVMAFLAWLPGCPVDHQREDCEALCDDLQACSLLPSPFGSEADGISARDNCVARCVLSDGDVRNKGLECTSADRAGTTDWCASTRCKELACCLVETFERKEILGPGRCSVTAKAVKESGKNWSREGCDFPCSWPACEDWPTSDVEAFCRTVTEAKAFVNQSEYDERLLTCASLLSKPIEWDGLEPGVATLGFQFRGVMVTDAGAPVEAGTYCTVVLGSTVPVGRAVSPKVPIPVPNDPSDAGVAADAPSPWYAYPCEEGELCFNGKDDDFNGVADGNDWKCRPDAGEAPVLDAGLDASDVEAPPTGG